MPLNPSAPRILRLSRPDDAAELARLERDGAIVARHDTIDLQLADLARIRTPERGRSADRDDVVRDLVGGVPSSLIGVWVFYPWSGRLVHLLDEAEFVEVRTAANRNKVTTQEQARLADRSVGVIGLSVGNAVALTVAAERSAGTIKLADFDELDLSNLNRLRGGVADLGVNKAVLAARQIAELDPYLDVQVFADGVDETTIDEFFDSAPALDLLVEECDSPWVKLLAREHARRRGVPVVMDCSDRGLLDVERFDLEPDRPLLHGLLGDLSAAGLRDASRAEEVAAISAMVGVAGLSDRMAASAGELDRTLTTWPQLASEVTHGGGAVATVARAVLLGEDVPSGRQYVDLPFGIGRAQADALVAEPVT